MHKCFVCQWESEKRKQKRDREINKGHNRDSFTSAQTRCLRGVREERLRGRRCNYMTALRMGGNFTSPIICYYPAFLQAWMPIPSSHWDTCLFSFTPALPTITAPHEGTPHRHCSSSVLISVVMWALGVSDWALSLQDKNITGRFDGCTATLNKPHPHLQSCSDSFWNNSLPDNWVYGIAVFAILRKVS